ncbi:MAG: Holliday junction branch migration protein RuvA, partial [Persicimonas sp.]
VSGIGKKTAQRLILEMKSSVDEFEFAELAPAESSGQSGTLADDLRSALENLGHSDSDIEGVISVMGDDIEEADNLEPLMREALQMLN